MKSLWLITLVMTVGCNDSTDPVDDDTDTEDTDAEDTDADDTDADDTDDDEAYTPPDPVMNLSVTVTGADIVFDWDNKASDILVIPKDKTIDDDAPLWEIQCSEEYIAETADSTNFIPVNCLEGPNTYGVAGDATVHMAPTTLTSGETYHLYAAFWDNDPAGAIFVAAGPEEFVAP
jgi:hypothetical protein